MIARALLKPASAINPSCLKVGSWWRLTPSTGRALWRRSSTIFMPPWLWLRRRAHIQGGITIVVDLRRNARPVDGDKRYQLQTFRQDGLIAEAGCNKDLRSI